MARRAEDARQPACRRCSGFLICAYLWWSLSWPARVAGFVWLATGIAYGAWKTQGFRKPIEFREANDEEAR